PECMYYIHYSACINVPHSFPTRRSSDLRHAAKAVGVLNAGRVIGLQPRAAPGEPAHTGRRPGLARMGAQPVDAGIKSRHVAPQRSEEHTSELQSRENLVCRLLLEKKIT